MLVAAAAAGPGVSVVQGQDSSIAITAERLIDVEQGRVISRGVVVVRGSRIAAVGPRESVSVPAGTRIIDLGNATLLPGLIDVHVHLLLAGRPRANAEATLRAGFTTVQDLGSLGGGALHLRDSVAAGVTPGPRILAAGPWLGVSGGVCDFNGIGVRGRDSLLARVRSDAARGADLIKLCITGWPGDGFAYPDSVELDSDAVAAVIREARKLGRPTVAHAIGRAGAASAVRNGIAGLAHAAFLDETTLTLMGKQGTWIASSLVSFGQVDSSVLSRLTARMQAAHRKGVKIVLGTDAGVVPHGSNAREFAALSRLGLSPMEAIQAGTIEAARALRVADSLGSLSTGKLADVIAVAGDPLTRIDAMDRVVLVMKAGRIYLQPNP